MRYLIHDSNQGAIIDIPSGLSGDGYGLLQALFVATYSPDKQIDHPLDKVAILVSLYDDNKVGPVHFDYGLSGASGASFDVVILPENTADEVKAAVSYIRNERDAVSINKIRIKKLHDFQKVVDLVAEKFPEKKRPAAP